MECGGEMKVGDATEQRLQSAACVGSEAARKGEDECFRCKRRGHWARQCPFNISNHNKLTAPSSSSSLYPVVRCPCGKGTCPISTSTTTKNPSRKYYSCPVPLSSSLGGRCNFFKWCDELVDFNPPMCPCGAGFSSLNQLTSGPLANRWYFSCRIRKNHGACSFFQWADPELNSIMNRYMRQSKGGSSSQHSWTSHQGLSTINHDSGKKEDFKLEELESPVVQNPLLEFALPTTDSPENMQNLSIVNSKQHKFLNDIAMQEAGSWNLSLGKALEVFQLMSQSDIQHCQIEFQRHISAAGDALTEGVIYRFSAYGWLGRLVFPPPRCLKDPAHATFFCCVFPSFDPVPVPDILEDVDVPDIGGSTVLTDSPSNIETDVPPLETPRQDTQLSCGILSGLKSPCSVIPVGDAVAGSIFKMFGEGLINILEALSSCDCERMLKVAEATFDTLRCLSIDCQPFYECIKEYIDFASRAVQIEEYMCKDVSSQQLIEEYDHKKAHFEEISCFHTMKMAEYKASGHRFQALCQEVKHVKDMLLQLEQEMSLYEKQTLELETHVLEISEDMSESERSMEAAYMEMEEVLTLELERESMLHAAKTSLEAARIQLQ